MKILESLSNFIWLFIVIGAIMIKVFIFPSEGEPIPYEPFSFNTFTYKVGEYVVSLVITGVFLLVVYKIAVWVGDRKRASKQRQ